MSKSITAYKAFNPDWTCRDFKFEVGKTYKQEGDIEICWNGFHACENPLDTLSYYSLIDGDGNPAKFAEVELSGDTDRKEDGDTKIAAAEITIKAELSIPDFIKKSVEWVMNAANNESEAASGYNSKLAASGNYSQLAASGDDSQLAASGYNSKLAASGNYSQLAASGYNSKLAASGYNSKLAASGDDSQLAASGYNSKLAASGDDSQLAASGYNSKLAASGNYSVIASSGRYAMAKGVEGTWISLASFNDEGKCTGFAVGCIGQDGLKPETWYRAEDNKLVEVA